MNKEEQNEINRYLAEEVSGEEYELFECACGDSSHNDSTPDAFLNNGKSWEFVQRVLAKVAKKSDRDAILFRVASYYPDNSKRMWRALTANPEAIANAVYEVLAEKENSDV